MLSFIHYPMYGVFAVEPESFYIIIHTSASSENFGVIMFNNLKWANHIQSAISKANRAIWIIRNSFMSFDLISLRHLYSIGNVSVN